MRPRLPGLARLGRALQGRQVEEAANCARALTALYGRMPEVELLPGGASRVPRALLTGRVLQDLAQVPWPYALMRQLDPDDPAFLPPLGMHPVLAARDRSLLGLPGRDSLAWVDPLGWCGIGDGPSVAVFFGEARAAWPIGRCPAESGRVLEPGADGAAPRVTVRQSRDEGGVCIQTDCQRGPLHLELRHFPVVIDGRTGFALLARLSLEGPAPRPVRLAFALRPAGCEGVAPIFHLSRDGQGQWFADGSPLLALAEPGDEVLTGIHGEPDPWLRLSGQLHGAPAQRPAELDRRCPVGLASAMEIHRLTLFPDEPVTRLAIIAPPPGTPAALRRTSGHSLWQGAQADRRGLLQSGCELRLVRHQVVLEAARMRLLLEPPRLDLGGLLGALALARLGFLRRAGDRIVAALARVRRDGTLPEGEGPETAAVLAWAAAEHLRWTDASAFARAARLSWLRLVDRLAGTEPAPGGFVLFGSRGSARWTALWRAAALVGSAGALREYEHVVRSDDVTRWSLAGARATEDLEAELGAGPWASGADRAPDASSAAMLAACWLGVVSPDHRGIAPTLRLLRERHWHGGGVLLHGGAHVAATALLVAAEEAAHPGLDRLDVVGRLASPTGALPTARHPARGAVGEGDDQLSAALFVLLAAERVQARRGVLRILPGLERARALPTPFGLIDVEGDTVRGTWRGAAPTIERISPGAEPAETEPAGSEG